LNHIQTGLGIPDDSDRSENALAERRALARGLGEEEVPERHHQRVAGDDFLLGPRAREDLGLPELLTARDKVFMRHVGRF
jgi:hypothetical protein